MNEEQGMDLELGSERGGKPRSIPLPLVDNVEAHARHIGPQQCPHRKGNAPREFRKHSHRLKLGCVDVGFAGPGNLVLVLGPKADAVDATPLLRLLTEQPEFIVFLLLAGQGKQILRQAVLGLLVEQVVAQALDQAPVRLPPTRERAGLETSRTCPGASTGR